MVTDKEISGLGLFHAVHGRGEQFFAKRLYPFVVVVHILIGGQKTFHRNSFAEKGPTA